MDEGVIFRTLIDPEATPGEVEVAMRAATPETLHAAHLALVAQRTPSLLRGKLVRTRMKQLRDEFPGIGDEED